MPDYVALPLAVILWAFTFLVVVFVLLFFLAAVFAVVKRVRADCENKDEEEDAARRHWDQVDQEFEKAKNIDWRKSP